MLNSSCHCPWDLKLAPILHPDAATTMQKLSAKHSGWWFICVNVLFSAQEMCSIRSRPYVFKWRFGLFFPKFTDEDIHPRRLRACLLVCLWGAMWQKKSESWGDWVRVCGRDSPQLQRLPWPAQGRVTQSRTERVPICHSCGPLHSKLGFSLGTSYCVLQAHMGHGISMSTMHDHILCLGLSTQVDSSHAHQRSNVTVMMITAHLICWPATSEVSLHFSKCQKN